MSIGTLTTKKSRTKESKLIFTAEKQKQKQIKVEYNRAQYFALQNKAFSGTNTINDYNREVTLAIGCYVTV